MNSPIERLLSISSSSLIEIVDEDNIRKTLKAEQPELLNLLLKKNGFYAFDSALHVFPFGKQNETIDLISWNSADLWKKAYGDEVQNLFFFAEDIFGGQFCTKENAVFYFEPETGEIEKIAKNIEEWASLILSESDYRTGRKLSCEWQEVNGKLKDNHRLIPKIPFVCGGSFSVDNLYVIESVKGMRFRGNIAQQIRDLPDGSKITFKLEP